MPYIAKEVKVGNLVLGGTHPIRIQSMTSTPTMDTRATVEQAIRLVKAGCEMVRITAPGLKEAANLQTIKAGLKQRGIDVPLIADIHFNPEAAEMAARLVEKVRINPGNYVGRSQTITNWSEREYQLELERIEARLYPLLKICKTHGTAIRIGINHGSLSRRIVCRYGDTPEGMVQSALEFTRMCDAAGFSNLVLSMKSSNVRIMVQSCMLLASRLSQDGLNYPLHLGVTEAADGEEGRLKSVVGIGALLARGIGDTIRVSLTEAPEFEIPVAKAIAARFTQNYGEEQGYRHLPVDIEIRHETARNPVLSSAKGRIGGKNPPAVLLGYQQKVFHAEEDGKLTALDQPLLYINDTFAETPLPAIVESVRQNNEAVIVAETKTDCTRRLIKALSTAGLNLPVILKSPIIVKNATDALIENALNPGNLLLDGLGEGVMLDADVLGIEDARRIGYGLLQATRRYITHAEYIACPSCGRTLFSIQQVLHKVKARTQHLRGLKIAVMGCIVNGPGEMADADYGYVGAGHGKVTLYKGNRIMHRNVPESEAVDALIALIKDGDDWIDC
ncbi:4-hydroxy-3-methylbut-2-en-1-yl diphosphate synthase [anaerobic digester metagenome]